MSFNAKYLPKSDVVFSVMFLNKELCEKTLAIILGENVELIDIVNEFKNDLHKAALNSIYFDVKTQTKDGRIITLDIQRQYIKDRIRNRTVYYACREVAAQQVTKSRYENLKNVIVSFILTEATLKWTKDNRKIILFDEETNEKYSDLLTIYEINIKHINDKNSQQMIILRDFFQIINQSTYDKFVSAYSDIYFGGLLLKIYDSAISDTSLLNNLVEEEKFMYRLSEEERMEEREEGKLEGLIVTCQDLGLSYDDTSQMLMKKYSLSKIEIDELMKKYWEN